MNVHEVIERFLQRSPLRKVVTILAIIAVIIAFLGGLFWAGTRIGGAWAESKYTRERDEAMLKAAQYKANEQVLKGQNDLLKKQNEEIAKERDAADARNRAEYARRDQERATQLQIDLKRVADETDPAKIICGTCEQYRKNGEELSPELCGRCWRQP